jgi:hypothetical protein
VVHILLNSYEHKQAEVTLPCGEDEFRDFIRSLLGKPQSITNRFHGAFDLNKQDLEQFHHLLLQRLRQQNKVQLIMFTARIVYDDDSTVQLNDFDSFMTYNEIRPLISTAVHMSWEFLVAFEDRKAPEKQQVDVPERFMAKSIAFVLVALIVSILLAVWATSTCDPKKPAFLCLTRKSEQAKAKAIQKSQRRFLYFCLSIVVSIACGIIGNYLFAVYIQGWKP